MTPSPGIEPSHISGRPAWEANAQPLRHPCWRCAFFCLFVCSQTFKLNETTGRVQFVSQSEREIVGMAR